MNEIPKRCIDPLNLPQVNHKDEDKKNNRVENLEWCTLSYNLNYNNGQKRRAKSRNYDEISKKRSFVQSKEVTQYDFDGEVIAVWKNARIAEQHGYDRTMINRCCLGNKKSHRGYLWKYSSNIEKQIPKKPIIQEDKQGLAHEKCPACESFCIGEYCLKCGQKLDWSD